MKALPASSDRSLTPVVLENPARNDLCQGINPSEAANPECVLLLIVLVEGGEGFKPMLEEVKRR